MRRLKEGIDFYYDEHGRMVFTREYLLRRGYCCGCGCKHCPYGFHEKYQKRLEQIKNEKKQKR